MYQIALTAWMYLTPVIYLESYLPEQYRFWMTHLNPMYYMIRLYRAVVYDGRLPTSWEVWPAVIIALVALGAGWYLFTKKSDEIAYRI
jgi:ABC-type polysaccharide/polyol phosphate export permease